MRSSDRAGDGVLGLQEKVDGAGGRSGREVQSNCEVVRQFPVVMFGAVQTQVAV